MEHFTDYNSLLDAFLGFNRIARRKNLNVGIEEGKSSLITCVLGLWSDHKYFKPGMRALYCKNPEEVKIFDHIFETYWGLKKAFTKSKITYKNQSNLTKSNKASLVMIGKNDKIEHNKSEAKNTSGANTREVLKQIDFAKVGETDIAELETLAEELWRQMTLRIKRKLKTNKKGRINIQSTIRKNLDTGGSMIKLVKKNKDRMKYNLVILLDVSGSMDKYSFYLLKFIYALRSNFEQLEAFIFSTNLIRITEELDKKDILSTLNKLSHKANNWSGGTKIGACLATFNEVYSRRVLSGRNMTILLSDGLDTGNPEVLNEELNKIKLRTNKLIWLNPLKGMEGYEPVQIGMKAALPALGHFASAHNINSLLQLEKILINA